MLPLSSKEQLRYLWYILLKAAEAKVTVNAGTLKIVLGEVEPAAARVGELCKKYKVPDLRASMSGQDLPNLNLSDDDLAKFKHGIPDFPPINESEAVKFNFLCAHYCIISYSDEGADSKSWSALQFWSSLNWEELKGGYLEKLNERLFEIVQVNFLSDADRKENQNERRKALAGFSRFSSEHAFLVVHHRDWSETLDGLNEIKAYYEEEKEKVEDQKSRAEDLLENAKSELDARAEAAISENEAKATTLLEEAQRRYPENLLSGFVERFQGDADSYGVSASRWLRSAFFSFVFTIIIAFYFLGHLNIQARQPNATMIEELTRGVTIIGLWDIAIFLVVLVYWAIKQRLSNWLSALDTSTQIPAGFWAQAAEAGRIALGFIIVLVPVYLLFSYFHISVETPAISAESFLVPKESQINWASMLSAAAPRILVLVLASAITLFCARMYRIQKHLESVNRYRATALASFSIFINNAGEETEEARARKDKLFDELAGLIYSPIQTGFTEDQKLKAADLANIVSSIAGRPK